MPENFERREQNRLQEIIEQLGQVEHFETEKGSVYEYDGEGHTKREKKKTGESFETQDITVFVDMDFKEWEEFKNAYSPQRDKAKNEKVYIVERQADDSPKIIRSISEVVDPDKLYLTISRNNALEQIKKATLLPTKRFNVFDFRTFEKDGEMFSERHIGHKVKDIVYRR